MGTFQDPNLYILFFFFLAEVPELTPGDAQMAQNDKIGNLETIKTVKMSVCTLQLHLMDNHSAK